MKKLFLLFLTYFFITQAEAVNKVSYGRHGMVVSAQHLATQVGLSILKKGGNAVDAAVAMGYALAVVHPCCGNIGGGGFMMIHQANGQNVVINFREKNPQKFHSSQKRGDFSYSTVAVPGTVLGLNTALERYGSMPLAYLMQPAIQLAEKGFILKLQDVQFLHLGAKDFLKQPNVGSIFLKRSQYAYRAGERLIQKELGNTLRLIAQKGSDVFYKGEIADAIVQASQKQGGHLSKADFSQYRVSIEKPLFCSYRGYTLITTPMPSVGGRRLCQLVSAVEKFPLKEYGYASLASLSSNLEAIRYVYRYKKTEGFSSSSIHKSFQNGNFRYQRKPYRGKQREVSMNTTSYMVADKKGNLVAVTYSLNGPFGAKVIAGDTGFFLNDELKDVKKFGQDAHRPLSYITQALLFKGSQPFLMLASPGGDTIPTQLLITIENSLDYRMPLSSAVNAPRYHFRWRKGEAYLEPEWEKWYRKKTALESIGFKIGRGSGMELGLPYWGGCLLF
jgi:gamma-glutamyltranspeptidase / glutathione hydrolase